MVKVKIGDRFLLALYAILGIACSLVIGGIAWFVFQGGFSIQVMYLGIELVDSPLSIIILVAIALLLLAWSIKILLLAFKREPKVDKSSVSVQNTEEGSVRISVQAMDMLVKQAIGSAEGVVDIKTRIINHEDSITVKIDMTLLSDVHIPNVTMLMQRSIKNFIEEFSGIAVREVTILVTKIVEVTPHPPLAIAEPKAQHEIIDQPDDAMQPSPEVEVRTVAVPDEIEETLDEVGADLGQPESNDAQDVPSEAPSVEEKTEELSEDQGEAEDPISEKDFW